MFTNLGKNNFNLFYKNYQCNIKNIRFCSKNINKDNYATKPAPRNPPDPHNEAEWKHIFEEVKGITNVAFRKVCSDEILGPNAGPECCYKVPEYYAYHRYSYNELIYQIGLLKAHAQINPPEDIDQPTVESFKEDLSKPDTANSKDDNDNFETLDTDINYLLYLKKSFMPFPIFNHFESIFTTNKEPIILIRQDGDCDRKNEEESNKSQETSNLKRGIKALERVFNKIFSRKSSNDETKKCKDDSHK